MDFGISFGVPAIFFHLHLVSFTEGSDDGTPGRTDLVPGCYIPTLRTKERECQKFLDWR